MNILREHKYWRAERWNEGKKTYTFETGSEIEFFSADQSEKLRGGRRDRLFINEANNISLQAFEELEVRTKEFIFLDWNPTNEFWFYDQVLGVRDDVDHMILTYKDNEALDERIVASIESRKARRGWWQVYGLGQLGEVEGKIYRDWKIIDAVPHNARLEVRGLDFGYSNDPSVVVDVYKYDGGYIVDEQCYQRGMSNKQIADLVKNLDNPETLVVADSAEPKSIDEIKSYGINIIGAVKGQGSVNQGIQFVQDQRISVTKRSVMTIKCYRNYLWKVDKDGKILNTPEHDFSDPMDAIRYALSSFTAKKDVDKDNRNAMSIMTKLYNKGVHM